MALFFLLGSDASAMESPGDPFVLSLAEEELGVV
jgi:hypothetical protein